MTTPSTLHMRIRARVLLGELSMQELSMHFNVEAKVRGCLCIAMKGSLWRSVPPVQHVHCVRDDVLCVRYTLNDLLAHFVSNCDTGGGR